jgi:hypothetical protein
MPYTRAHFLICVMLFLNFFSGNTQALTCKLSIFIEENDFFTAKLNIALSEKDSKYQFVFLPITADQQKIFPPNDIIAKIVDKNKDLTAMLLVFPKNKNETVVEISQIGPFITTLRGNRKFKLDFNYLNISDQSKTLYNSKESIKNCLVAVHFPDENYINEANYSENLQKTSLKTLESKKSTLNQVFEVTFPNPTVKNDNLITLFVIIGGIGFLAAISFFINSGDLPLSLLIIVISVIALIWMLSINSNYFLIQSLNANYTASIIFLLTAFFVALYRVIYLTLSGTISGDIVEKFTA